ncbi:MAG: glutamate--tRNA ligase [Candidatus Eremiobacteraeota bacterium]|nr:glutamate--tRNA ligase [Candidatus Eremiobacteraeota bacterium]MBV9057283.1 glutamate--tRNA ligase [Candidatus Eremiobacteraeota bacterium]
MSGVRTRVAPSPTGDPHVGTAYVALVNYCFAKKHGGEFILRIEDTDAARSTAESERLILDALRWCGIAWDEGPDVGGPHGPYRQSERSEIYRRYADELVSRGQAFPCFCSEARLHEMRAAQRAAAEPSRYDGLCLTLSPGDVQRRISAGEPYVIRLRVPNEGLCVVSDLRRGDVEFEYRSVDMQVLVKSDGMPTYHLANVVDDHLMRITHVFRGEEWLSSAPKHLLLYSYFGWEPPKLLHLPLLRNPDKSKLSKRKNPTGILFYRALGYLPEALINFLALLANAARDGEDELMDLHAIVRRFEVEQVPVGGPIFDVPKLDWLNARYIRERLTPEALMDRVARWAGGPERLNRLAEISAPRIERLSDLAPLVGFLFSGRLALMRDDLRVAKLEEVEVRQAFALAIRELDALPVWDAAGIETVIKRIAEALGKKARDAARPFYVAITGSATSIPLFDSMELLGRDLVRERLRNALALLGTPSKREQEVWESLLASAQVPA